MATTNNRPPPLPLRVGRRRSSTKIQSPTGTFSVRLPDGSYLKDDDGKPMEGVPEGKAWDVFIKYRGYAQLLRGTTVVSSRSETSPVINRQRTT